MRILCVCDKGVNRAVHIASLLKFRGHDTIPVGTETSSPETLETLYDWADAVIVTNSDHRVLFPIGKKMWLWQMDDLPRPYNKHLCKQTLVYIDEYRDRLEGA